MLESVISSFVTTAECDLIEQAVVERRRQIRREEKETEHAEKIATLLEVSREFETELMTFSR